VPKKRTVWLCLQLLLALGTPVLLGVVALYFESHSLQPQGSIVDAHLVGLVSIALSLLPIALMLIGFIALIYVRRRLFGVLLMASCIACVLAAFASTELRNSIRLSAFEQFAARAAPLVKAIEDYQRVRGHLPEKLDRLVPDYLSQVPETGLGAYPEFEYLVIVPDTETPTWGLTVEISGSPPERLLYRASGDYSDIDATKTTVSDWTLESHQIQR